MRPRRRGVDLIRLGTVYGGWWVPPDEIGFGKLAYCAGAGEDISFDLALHERGCRVVTFDPTPRAIEHVRTHAPSDERFQFCPVGWWDGDAELRFWAPRDPSHVSHSIVNLQKTDEFFVGAVKPVCALMKELGDESVDLIKMDIEGAEYRVIRSLLGSGPRPRVLCVEFDQPQPIWRTASAVMRLRAAGYSLVKVERWNYTFVNRSVRRNAVPVAVPIKSRSDVRRNVVALTFDDGPAEWTVPILDTLREARIRATFFVVGDAIAGREATLRRASAEGHEIGNHGLRHRPLDTLVRDEVRAELDETGRRVRATIGREPTVFRPPYFRYNATVLEAAAECGFSRVINASVIPDDWINESADEISKDVLAATRRGSIIDLHDGRPPHDAPHAHGKSRDDRWPTVGAVKTIVPALLERGFEFVTVSELLAL